MSASTSPTAPLTCDQAPTSYAGLQRRLTASGTYWVALAVTRHEVGYQVGCRRPGVDRARSHDGESRADMFDQGRLSTFPGLAIVIAPLAINLLDPRSRNVREVW